MHLLVYASGLFYGCYFILVLFRFLPVPSVDPVYQAARYTCRWCHRMFLATFPWVDPSKAPRHFHRDRSKIASETPWSLAPVSR